MKTFYFCILGRLYYRPDERVGTFPTHVHSPTSNSKHRSVIKMGIDLVRSFPVTIKM